MDKFLEKYNLSRLNHDEVENLNRLTASKEIESVIKNFPTNKSPGPDGCTGKFYQTFKADLICILLKLFQKIEEDVTLPNSIILFLFYIIFYILVHFLNILYFCYFIFFILKF